MSAILALTRGLERLIRENCAWKQRELTLAEKRRFAEGLKRLQAVQPEAIAAAQADYDAKHAGQRVDRHEGHNRMSVRSLMATCPDCGARKIVWMCRQSKSVHVREKGRLMADRYGIDVRAEPSLDESVYWPDTEGAR